MKKVAHITNMRLKESLHLKRLLSLGLVRRLTLTLYLNILKRKAIKSYIQNMQDMEKNLQERQKKQL